MGAALERRKYLIQLYKQATNKEEVDGNTIVNGATIYALTNYNSPGFRRMVNWCKEQIANKAHTEEDQLKLREEKLRFIISEISELPEEDISKIPELIKFIKEKRGI